VQAQAAAGQMVGRRRQHSERAGRPNVTISRSRSRCCSCRRWRRRRKCSRPDGSGPGGVGPPPQEAHQHRQHDPGGVGARLQLKPQAQQRRDPVRERGPLPGEGGCEGLVLQPPPEGEADEPQFCRRFAGFVAGAAASPTADLQHADAAQLADADAAAVADAAADKFAGGRILAPAPPSLSAASLSSWSIETACLS